MEENIIYHTLVSAMEKGDCEHDCLRVRTYADKFAEYIC